MSQEQHILDGLLNCPHCNGRPLVKQIGSIEKNMIIRCSKCNYEVSSRDVAGLTSRSDYEWNRIIIVKKMVEETDVLALIIEQVRSEYIRASSVHPKSFSSAHEGYAILKEEVDEMWDAIKEDDVQHARREAIQVGAMAIRFLMDLQIDVQINQTLKEISKPSFS